ncbi:MAG TPA: gamma-glutamyltransferase [Candidatus Polarisedimenticolaceae bacterium]|nr:gamma-glutamyltransferase [Candidatus Polarisedimenticolaceae bacterium]
MHPSKPRLPRYARLLLVAAVVAGWLPLEAASRPAARGTDGMVVSPEARATAVGVEVLAAGGNAVDAAVAVAFALGVTYPLAAGLGGGGFLLIRQPDGSYHALDFRETAPAAIGRELFVDDDGRPIAGLSLDTGLAVGVPGTVAGLAAAHARWGSLPWADLVRPAISLARDGFEVYPWLEHAFDTEAEHLLADDAAREIFAPVGRPLASGQRLVQADLATTLEAVAQRGPRGFYEGQVAARLVAAVQKAGGVLNERDLADYEPSERRPIEGRYRGHRVVTFPPPSSGGVTLLQMLAMLERFDLGSAGWGASLTVHLMTEAERRAFADRARWLGDPGFYAVPLDRLLDTDYLKTRAASIRPDRATASRSVGPGDPSDDDRGETMHFSIGDGDGRAIATTITLNRWFGTGIVAAGTGVLLNNEIDDFAIVPGTPNLYGLSGGEANAIAGGKRPLSSMTPTIVEAPGGGPRPLLVLGSPGGSTIPTTILQVLLNVIDHGMTLQEAVDAPRLHHQWQPDRIVHEPRALPPDVMVNLIARGHALVPAERPLGNVSAIGVAADGAWLGAADPRRQGAAAGR